MTSLKSIAPALLVLLSLLSNVHAGYTPPGQYFVEPMGWNVGEPNSTHQLWDTFATTAGNAPDVGYDAVPSIGNQPTLSASAPGFRTSSTHFYSFSGDYPVSADIYNHGTGLGTHVIVQTGATLGGDGESVLPGTLEVVDLSGNPLAGGDSLDALIDGEEVFTGSVTSSFGTVTFQAKIWEFFLPAYAGDFRVRWTEQIHSSFDQLRVDSMITSSAFAPSFVPEPTTFGLLAASVCGLAAMRKRGSAR